MATKNITLTVKKSDLDRAIAWDTNWQHQTIRLLLIPSVAKVWQKLNSRWPNLAIERIPGSSNEYLLRYGPDWYWNSYKSCHISAVWDGIRRETKYRFAESLRNLTLSLNGSTNSPPDLSGAKQYGITLAVKFDEWL